MARIIEDTHVIIEYNERLREKYWRSVSMHIIKQYGRSKFKNSKLVKQILLDIFDFLINDLERLIKEETSLNFYIHVFWLHEQSIELYFKQLGGYKLKNVSTTNFAVYRRTLKLILEQGCVVDFDWPKEDINWKEIARIEAKIQNLFYLSTWVYELADIISYQNMLEDCHFIDFDSEDYIAIDYKYHYGQLYQETVGKIEEDYGTATFDQSILKELSIAIKNCLNIDFYFSKIQIHEIKTHHSSSLFQTIEPYVLPINLQTNGASKINSELYYNGLIISAKNKISIKNTVLKPYSMNRYLFRPILVYMIGGIERAFVTINKFDESIRVIATNAIHWSALPEEWIKNLCLKNFMHSSEDKHDKILENEIGDRIIHLKLMYDRNIKSLKQKANSNLIINNHPGEIDFLIINHITNELLVIDAKYHRARYEGVGYYADYNKFISYEKRMTTKINWIKQNLIKIEEHFKLKYKIDKLALSGYRIEGAFFINTPTFYMFNGNYKAITLNKIMSFLSGNIVYPGFQLQNQSIVNHPYFRKPTK